MIIVQRSLSLSHCHFSTENSKYYKKKETQSELKMLEHPLPQKGNKISQSGFA